ncbi:MAG: nucleotidyltransferase domain-containing protein [Nitrospirae bacterium]|nr:nucleotidyltransferase domain-containing protein [Nitrospirota bacterium]
MAEKTDKIVTVVRKYIEELESRGIRVIEVMIFGSYAKGTFREDSDIDIAIVSPDFSGDRFADRRLIVPLRRKIDNRIEPIPFRPEDFNDGGFFAEEIKKTGIKVK